jgi:hypothetical protein
MKIVLANDAFAGVGGSETYLLTVAEQLQRLGHETTIYARVCGPMADLATARGVPMARESGDLPASCDVVLAQDGAMAYELGERWPETPQVFVAHSPIFDLQLPPLISGIASAVVVLCDRVEQRIRAMDIPYEIVRLRQPIDTERFIPRGAPRSPPQRALLLGVEPFSMPWLAVGQPISTTCSALTDGSLLTFTPCRRQTVSRASHFRLS